MKKLLVFTLTLGLVVLVSGLALAQAVGLEAHGLYAFNFDGDTDLGTIEPDDSFGGGGNLVFCATPYLKFDLGIDYLKADLKDSGIPGVDGGDVEMLPLTLGVRAGPTFEPVFLYAGAGIGYSYNDASGGGDWVDLKDCVTYYACLGAEIGLTEHLVLRPELRYNWLIPELEVGLFGGWQEDWKLDHFQGRLGLGVYF